jgi:hypothetical protein
MVRYVYILPERFGDLFIAETRMYHCVRKPTHATAKRREQSLSPETPSSVPTLVEHVEPPVHPPISSQSRLVLTSLVFISQGVECVVCMRNGCAIVKPMQREEKEDSIADEHDCGASRQTAAHCVQHSWAYLSVHYEDDFVCWSHSHQWCGRLPGSISANNSAGTLSLVARSVFT